MRQREFLTFAFPQAIDDALGALQSGRETATTVGRDSCFVPREFFNDDAGNDYHTEDRRHRIGKLTVGAMKAAGKPGCSFHTLRHSTASWMAQAGVDLARVMKFMRHSSFEMTLRYAHLRPDHLDGAVAALEAAIVGNNGVPKGHSADTESATAT